MSRALLLLLLLVPALACGPLGIDPSGEGQPGPGDTIPNRPTESALSACLLDGGQLETDWTRDLDAAGINALAVAHDGTVAVGEGLGAVGILPEALTLGIDDVFHDLLLPAGGHAVTSLAFSADGLTLASGDAAGQVAATPVRADGFRLWEQVTEAVIQAVAIRAGGETVAWVDAGWAGQPVLWPWTESEGVPDPVETTLWTAGATTFSHDDALWIVAGDWYGVPSFDVRLADAPDVVVGTWMMTMETLGMTGATFTAVTLRDNDAKVIAAGTHGFEDDGFLVVVDLDGLDRTPPAEDAGPAQLAEGRVALLDGHRPVAAHLLPGDEVLLTAGEAGDVVAWAVDGLARLGSVSVDGLGATAVDHAGGVLLAGDGEGRLYGFVCAR